MKIKEWLDKVAHVETMPIGNDFSEVWCSNFDGSYITHTGMEDNVKFLAALEITDELTHGVGRSSKDGKWYGWSHRAIFGFEIGSKVAKGDCAYRAQCVEDEIKAAILFWAGDNKEDVTAKDCSDGIIAVSWTYDQDTPNESLRGTEGGSDWHYDANNFGNGEWTAETMDDAKQMAIDFNEGVS